MNTIKCIRCGAENQDDYKFCMNCGAVLPQKNETAVEKTSVVEDNSGKGLESALDFDGVSAAEMTAYVNPNANKLLPKFYNMEKFGQKVSFCFPVFILGLIFGFFGISMWCFYRKMKKLGLISLVLGIFLILGDLILNFNTTSQLVGGYAALIKDLIANDGGYSQALTQSAMENLLTQYDSSYIRIFSFLSQYVGSLSCPVLMGMFGLHIYKNKAIKDIKALKDVCPDEILLSQISAKGGTSMGLAAIPIIVHILTSVLTVAPLLISFLSVI